MKDAERPDYITYYDPAVEYYILNVIAYLPEKRQKELMAKAKDEEEKLSIDTDQSSLLTSRVDKRAPNLNETNS